MGVIEGQSLYGDKVIGAQKTPTAQLAHLGNLYSPENLLPN